MKMLSKIVVFVGSLLFSVTSALAGIQKLNTNAIDNGQEVGIVNSNDEYLDNSKLNLRPSSNIIPLLNGYYDVGSTAFRFEDGYFENVDTTSATVTTLNGGRIGEVMMYVSVSTPTRWVVCHGQSLSTTTYSALYAIIGYSFGGSGANFNIPDFRGIFPKGAGQQGTASFAGTNYTGTLGTYTQDKLQGFQIGGATGGTTYYGWTADAGNRPNGSAVASNSMPYLNSTVQGNAAGWYPQSNGSNGTPRVGNTTEPASLGIHFYIYAGI